VTTDPRAETLARLRWPTLWKEGFERSRQEVLVQAEAELAQIDLDDPLRSPEAVAARERLHLALAHGRPHWEDCVTRQGGTCNCGAWEDMALAIGLSDPSGR
jgi:hypothetical protein